MAARWLVLTWRLPSTSSSTPRVATWRSLQRLGAVTLTPGAAIVPFSEHLLEQLDWIADDITDNGGEAFVLRVAELSEADEEEVRRRMREDRSAEYARIRDAAQNLARTAAGSRFNRELAVLERGLARAVERDHLESVGRAGAERAIRVARKRREV